MKGPFERLKYDLRRVWECPECHHKERADGTVTTVFCRCQTKKKDPLERVVMTLVEDRIQRRLPAFVPSTEQDAPPLDVTAEKPSPPEVATPESEAQEQAQDTPMPKRRSVEEAEVSQAPTGDVPATVEESADAPNDGANSDTAT